MRKLTLFIVIISCAIALSSCEAAKYKPVSPQKPDELQELMAQSTAVEEMRETIFNGLDRGTLNLLYTGTIDDVKILNVKKEATVFVRVLDGFCIPTVASQICPLVLSTVDDHDFSLKKITLQSYRENKDGMIIDSLCSWESEDGNTGLFQIISKKFIKPNYTIADIEDYYSDYKDVVEKIKAGK